MPNDHARTLVELLRIAGGEGAALLRRWVAALLAAPQEERESIVAAVERRIIETYDADLPEPDERLVHIESEPAVHDDFTEIIVKSFAVAPAPKKPKSRGKSRKSA